MTGLVWGVLALLVVALWREGRRVRARPAVAWAAVALVAWLALAACSDDAVEDLGAEKVAALCRQWQVADYESATGSVRALDTRAALGPLLPRELLDDAVLAFYPSLGPPPPDADTSGNRASQAGDRLHRYRREVCGPEPSSAFSEFFVAEAGGYVFEDVYPSGEVSTVRLPQGQECFTDPGWMGTGAPFESGSLHAGPPAEARRGAVDDMHQCRLPVDDL